VIEFLGRLIFSHVLPSLHDLNWGVSSSVNLGGWLVCEPFMQVNVHA